MIVGLEVQSHGAVRFGAAFLPRLISDSWSEFCKSRWALCGVSFLWLYWRVSMVHDPPDSLKKDFGAHTVTGGTASSVTLITFVPLLRLFVNQRWFWLFFITTLIPKCYWMNPVETLLVVLVVLSRCFSPRGLCWPLLLVCKEKNTDGKINILFLSLW